MCKTAPSRAAIVEPLEVRRHFATGVGVRDMAITVTAISAMEVQLGGKFNVKTLLENVGNVPITGRTVNIRLVASTDTKFSLNDRLLASVNREIDGFAVGAKRTTTIPITAISSLPARSYNILARLTPGGPDQKASNNTFAYPQTVKFTSASVSTGVDLQLTGYANKLTPVFPFGPTNPVFVNLKNRGTSALTKPIMVGFYASENSTFGDSDDIYLSGTTFNKKLNPGATAKVDLSFKTPLTFSTGFYYVGAYADFTKVIKEGNETNNWLKDGIKYHF